MDIIETVKTHIRKYYMLCVSLKIQQQKTQNYELRIFMAHLDNTGNNPDTAWKRFWSSIKHPMVVIPTIGAILVLTIGYLTTNGIGFWGELTKLLSVVLVSIGINHFTTIFKELKEYQLLKFKGETTIKIIEIIVSEILNKDILDVTDLNNLDKYNKIIDTWIEYYPKGETILTDIHRKAKKDSLIETDSVKKNKLESLTEKIELNRQEDGDDKYFKFSGGTISNG